MVTKIRAATAVAALAVAPVACPAASVVLSYANVQVSTDATFTTFQTLPANAGNVFVAPPGQYVRFTLRATVTDNPNSPAAISNGIALGSPQPTDLGIGQFAGSFVNANAAVLVPRSAGSLAVSVATVNPNFATSSSKGGVNLATGDVGTGPTLSPIGGSMNPLAIDRTNATSLARLTTGVTGGVAVDYLFKNLTYSVPSGTPAGRATLTARFPLSSLALFTTADDGDAAGVLPTYGSRGLTAADMFSGPGPITFSTVAIKSLTASDLAGESSFTGGGHWLGGASPAAVFGYAVGAGLTLRTPADSASATFAGGYLVVGDNGATPATLLLKNADHGGVQLKELTLNGGAIRNGGTSVDASTTARVDATKLTIEAGGGALDTGTAGRTLTIGGAIVGVGPLAVTGGGTVDLDATDVTYTGPTTVSPNTRLLARSAAATNLLINPGGVDLAGSGARLDFRYADGASPAATVRAILAAGSGLASKFSAGQIRSTALPAGHLLGYLDSNATGTVSVRVTLPGDADLDGGVSINDFNALAGNFGKSIDQTWAGGDFDYDGGVSINDFNLLAGSFGRTLAGSAAATNHATTIDFAGLLTFAAAHDDLAAFEAVTGVPEPASGMFLGGIAAMLIRRRGPRYR